MGRRSGFNLEEIDQALAAAGATEEIRAKVKRSLAGTRKPGRKPEEDDALLILLADRVNIGAKPYAAAGLVTEGMPNPKRKITRSRIYKKYLRAAEQWRERARLAKLTEQEQMEERRQELLRVLEQMRRE